ncbi:expressed unknown protein [Seminavis robusta]|uniref:Uncharacterized protein n=1 Tax=Seminavis robusta TaxID=568900 RepID=A0A9N8DF29_9STRA|nr:expressed unknown protein [Seminavis robusta]|eukprot:Sro113_g056010.1 n/a (177) ;mRNA; f:43327-44236
MLQKNRVLLTTDEDFWKLDYLKSKVIHFWTTDDDAPESPPLVTEMKRKLDELDSEVKTQRLEIRQLQHQSGGAHLRQKLWAAKQLLPVAEVENLYSSWTEGMDTSTDFNTLLTTIQNTNMSSEEHVQSMSNSIMCDLGTACTFGESVWTARGYNSSGGGLYWSCLCGGRLNGRASQ